jgi:hypothetical protein
MAHISPHDQARIAALTELQRHTDTIYGLTEQFAAARSGQDIISHQIKRRYNRLKVSLTGAGFDHLSQLASGMEIAAGRSGSQRTKARILREGVASIRFQLDTEEKLIRQAALAEGGENEEEGAPPG